MQYLTQTSELTLQQLKALAKAWNVQPTGDKRKKQTWVDALNAKRRELAAPEEVEQPQETTTEALWMPAVNEDGEQFKLGNYSDLYGTEQWQMLMKLAVNDCVEQNNLYRDFYSRAIELGLIDRDPGFDGGVVTTDS